MRAPVWVAMGRVQLPLPGFELTDADAEQLFPVMAMREGRCAHEAALRASASDLLHLQGLHDLLERSAAAHDLDGHYPVNHEFHSAVQAMAANRWLDRATTHCAVSCACGAVGN